jgi:leucine-rich repeat kinase 1
MSLDLSAPVNLKLSDYGISKYNWGGRSVGMVGTPGYQAPEILDGKAYDEKVSYNSML